MLDAVRSECEFVRTFPLKYSRRHFGAKEPGNSIILTALVNFGRPSEVFDFKTANCSARVVDPCGEGVGRSRPRDCRQGSVEEAIADFDKRMDTLDNIQELIEVELDGDELLADIEKAADFRDVCRKQRTAAKRMLSDISTTPAGDDVDCVSNHYASTQDFSREASLPKLELPTFSGDVTKLPSLWD